MLLGVEVDNGGVKDHGGKTIYLHVDSVITTASTLGTLSSLLMVNRTKSLERDCVKDSKSIGLSYQSRPRVVKTD